MIKYYKIIDKNTVGKIDNDIPFLFISGKWAVDDKHTLMDRLIGYEEGEGIGGTSTLTLIESISEEEALSIVSKST